MRIVPDKIFVQYKYYTNFGKKLNLENPKTFNEKIQWLKLYDHQEKYTMLVDKIKAKEYIAKLIGINHIIPTLHVWDDLESIDLDILPEKFVIKCNHDSGGVFICRDKNTFDWITIKRKLKSAIKENYYWGDREWPYKGVQPKVFAESYLEESVESVFLGITDYKFFVFNGEPKIIYISKGLEKHTTARISFYDLNGKELPFHRKDFYPIGEPLQLPENYEEMLNICRIIANDISNDFIRIDLYSVRGNVYFSELTLYPCGTGIPFEPEEWDQKLGELLTLHMK